MAIIGHPIMRIPITFVALVPLARQCRRCRVPNRAHAEPWPHQEAEASWSRPRANRAIRWPRPPASRASTATTLAALSAKHQAEALNRVAGVYVQRGSGAESLAAIRSPVLSGAGACGAFLVPKTTCPSARWASAISTRCSSSTTSRRAPSKCCAARARPCTAPAPCMASSTCSRRASRTCPSFSVGRRGRLGLLQARATRRRAASSADWGSRRLRLGTQRAGLARFLGCRRGQAQSARGRRSRRRRLAPARRGHGAQPGHRGLHPGLQQLSRRRPRAAAIRIPRLSATPRARESRRISSATTASRATAASSWPASTAARAWISSSTS